MRIVHGTARLVVHVLTANGVDQIHGGGQHDVVLVAVVNAQAAADVEVPEGQGGAKRNQLACSTHCANIGKARDAKQRGHATLASCQLGHRRRRVDAGCLHRKSIELFGAMQLTCTHFMLKPCSRICLTKSAMMTAASRKMLTLVMVEPRWEWTPHSSRASGLALIWSRNHCGAFGGRGWEVKSVVLVVWLFGAAIARCWRMASAG